MPANLENSSVAQDWKRSVFILIPKKGNAKECSNFSKPGFHMNRELLDVQAGFRRGRGTRDQIANFCWIIKKVREFQKNIYLLTLPKPLTVWITTNCGKFFKRWKHQTT